MPNWASNQLTVRGTPASLREFSEAAAGLTSDGEPTPLSFEALFPTPAHLLEDAGETAHGVADLVILADGSVEPPAADDFGWRREHWGVERELREPAKLRSEPRKLTFRFYTASTGPVPLFAVVAERFPALSFELAYGEGGWSHAGAVAFEKGKPKYCELAYMDLDGALTILDRYWPEEAADWREVLELDHEDADAA